MNKQKTVDSKVLAILRECPETRYDDMQLILMNDGSMFAGLMKFKDKNFWEKHKTISFDTLTDRQTYEVIAVFKTVVYTDSPESFKYYQFVNAETAEDFTAYVEKCKELSLYDTDVTAEYGDKLLTLSTCEYSRTNGRLVVVAKLINE